jgi:hypothetical protein
VSGETPWWLREEATPWNGGTCPGGGSAGNVTGEDGVNGGRTCVLTSKWQREKIFHSKIHQTNNYFTHTKKLEKD